MGATPKSTGSGGRWLMRLWMALTSGGRKTGRGGGGVSRSALLMLLALTAVAAVSLLSFYTLAAGGATDKSILTSYGAPSRHSGSSPSNAGSTAIAGSGNDSPAPFYIGPKEEVHPHGVPWPPASPAHTSTPGQEPQLVQLLVGPQRRGEIQAEIGSGSMGGSWTLTQRQTCDTELLLNGGFSPLVGFMDRPTYERVVGSDMRLGQGYGLGVAADEENGVALVASLGYEQDTASSAAADPSTSASHGPYRAPGVAGPTLPSEGLLWPMPITLDLTEAALAGLTTVDGRTLADCLSGAARGSVPIPDHPAMSAGPYGLPVLSSSRLLLRDAYHNAIAVLTITDMWRPDLRAEAVSVFGSDDDTHPGVHHLLHSTNPIYVGGVLEGLALPQHYDFQPLRRTPAQVRAELSKRGWTRTVAFQTRNPMHRAHIELTRLAGEQAGAGVLLHPVVGMTKPGDVEYAVRVRCYEAVAGSGRYYRPGGVLLSLLPLAMRMGGPREALWHAIIRKNYGATHFIVGRDHAGVKSGRTGKDFYGPYDAQKLVVGHGKELGVQVIPFQEVEYVPRLDQYLPLDKIGQGEKTLSISGTKFRAMMARGADIPAWFSDPEVISILRALQPPTRERGFVVFFSGLSGGGKTTLSHALIQRMQALVPTRKITILDGDVVRTHLSKGLGFSITDRNTNIERIGFVAAEAARHGGIVIAAPIAPFDASRQAVRRMVQEAGAGFILVHVATTVGECASRDVKGLYGASGYGRLLPADGTTADTGSSSAASWRADLSSISNDLTGISHPYEQPLPLPESALLPALADAAAACSGAKGGAGKGKGKDGPVDAGSLAGIDVWLDTEDSSVGEGAAAIVARLVQLGFIEEEEGAAEAGKASGSSPVGGTSTSGFTSQDDDGTGRKGSRLTAGEHALVQALEGLKPADSGSSAPTLTARACPSSLCGAWTSRLTSSLPLLARVFPTAAGETVGPLTAAKLLLVGGKTGGVTDGSGSTLTAAVRSILTSAADDSAGSGPATCRPDWDAMLVPAVHAGSGKPFSMGDAGASSSSSIAGLDGPDAHGSGLDGPDAHGSGLDGPDAHGSGAPFEYSRATRQTLVRLHAGLPSRGSPSSRQLQAMATEHSPSSASSSSLLPVLTVGQQPPRLVLVLLGAGVGEEAAASALKRAIASGTAGSAGAAMGFLPSARVAASREWAAAVEGGKGKGSGAESGAVPIPPLFVPVDAWAPASGSDADGPASSHLPESARVAAAHDLWTGLRWAAAAHIRPFASTASATGVHPPLPTAFVLVPTDASSSVLELAPSLLRLDPCLRVLVVTPGGAEGDGQEEYIAAGAVVAGSRLQVVRLEA